ncbi:MAG TPA: YdcF family protein [bacterium]|nr:YdcF family protein [bacterium]
MQPVPPDSISADHSPDLPADSQSAPDLRGNHRRRPFRCLAVLLVMLVAVLSVAYYFREPILIGIGQALVYESAIQPCDVAAVFIGGGAERLERAVELYQAGYAPRILLTMPRTLEHGVPSRDLYELERRQCQAVLDYHRIDPRDVHWGPQPFYSTYSEAVYLLEWMRRQGFDSALVVTGYFQSRRAKWSLDRVFQNQSIDIRLVPAPPDLYSATRWWRHEEGIVMVENEYLKNLYYRVRGLFGHPG